MQHSQTRTARGAVSCALLGGNRVIEAALEWICAHLIVRPFARASRALRNLDQTIRRADPRHQQLRSTADKLSPLGSRDDGTQRVSGRQELLPRYRCGVGYAGRTWARRGRVPVVNVLDDVSAPGLRIAGSSEPTRCAKACQQRRRQNVRCRVNMYLICICGLRTSIP
jgi:hypothetical protein